MFDVKDDLKKTSIKKCLPVADMLSFLFVSAANWLTQISNERKPANGRLFWYKIKVGKNAAYKTRQMKLWTALLS